MSARCLGGRSWLWAVFGMLLVGAAFFSRTEARYEPIRVKVVRDALDAPGRALSVSLTESPRLALLRAPVVLVVRARHDGARAVPVTVRVNDTPAGSFTLASGETTRADLTLPLAVRPKAGDTITLRCDCEPWRLDYLEIGNVHGSSNSYLKFLVVPSAYGPQAPSTWLGLLLMGAVLALTLLDRPVSRRRPAQRAFRALQGFFAIFLVTVLVAPLASAFMLVLPLRTLVVCAVILSLGGIWPALKALREYAIAQLRWRPVLVDTGLVALAVSAFYCSALWVMLEPYRGNPSGLLVIDRHQAARFPPLSHLASVNEALFLHDAGYDGQFFYFMAFDPLLRAHADAPQRYRAFIDAPPYRYGRIGFSLLTKALSADRPRWYPVTMVALVVGAIVTGAVCLAGIFAHYGRSPAWALLYMLVPAFILSMQVTLPEPIAAAALLGGYWSWLRGQRWLAAALFALALLVRETSAILLLALVAWEFARPGRRTTGVVLATALLPLMLWRAYVCWALWPDWGWEGLFFDPRNMGLPFAGIYTLLTKDLSAPGIAYPAVLVAGLGLAVAHGAVRRDALSAALLAYAALAVSLNYPSIWSAVGNGERGTYEVCLLPMVAFAGLDEQSAHLRPAFLAFFGGLATYQLFGATSFGIVRMALGM